MEAPAALLDSPLGLCRVCADLVSPLGDSRSLLPAELLLWGLLYALVTPLLPLLLLMLPDLAAAAAAAVFVSVVPLSGLLLTRLGDTRGLGDPNSPGRRR